MAVFRELRGVNVKFWSSNPEKAHPCAEPRRLTYYAWKGIATKFCMSVDIQDLITCATFCDNRLRGLGVVRVEFPVFPLTCVVALRPLTTLSHYRASVWYCFQTARGNRLKKFKLANYMARLLVNFCKIHDIDERSILVTDSTDCLRCHIMSCLGPA